MKRWITAIVPANQKSELAEPPPPPMAGPSGRPAGIDHLMAQVRRAEETVGTPAEDPYDSLMPISRLTAPATILLPPPVDPACEPAAPLSVIAAATSDTDENLAANEQQDVHAPAEDTAPTAQEATPEGGRQVTFEPAANPPQASIEPVPAATNGVAPAPAAVAPSPPEPPTRVPPMRWDTLQAMAQTAMQQGDPDIAMGWWQLMRLAFPEIVCGYTDCALALGSLGRFEEGRRLLDEAEIHIQEEPAIPVTRALLEARAGNMDAAVDGWRAAATLPTSTARICARLVEALEQQSRHDEADAVLGQAVHVPRFQHPALLAKAVSVAVRRADWSAVAERLVALGSAATVDQTLSIDLDKVLVSLRDGDPAGLAAVIQAPWVGPVMASPQTDPYRLIGQARLAQLCGRHADTLARLATLRAVMPKTSDAYLRVEAILRDAGSSVEADATLAEAKAQFEDDADVWIRIGVVAEARGDWTGAVAHWTAVGPREEREHPDAGP